MSRGRQEARLERQEAHLGPSWAPGAPSLAPGGLSGGRLGRQEARLEAVPPCRGRLGARRPVLSARRRTQGRLDRQEERPEAVFGASRRRTQGRLGLSGGRLEGSPELRARAPRRDMLEISRFSGRAARQRDYLFLRGSLRFLGGSPKSPLKMPRGASGAIFAAAEADFR